MKTEAWATIQCRRISKSAFPRGGPETPRSLRCVEFQVRVQVEKSGTAVMHADSSVLCKRSVAEVEATRDVCVGVIPVWALMIHVARSIWMQTIDRIGFKKQYC